MSHPGKIHVRDVESHDGWQVGQHDQEERKVPAKNAIIKSPHCTSVLTHSLEDGDITIFRLLWLRRCLHLMQGQHVWALSNIRVKELDIGGHLLFFNNLMIMQFKFVYLYILRVK